MQATPRTPLQPVHSGEERCAPGHSWGAGVRTYYLIHYVVSGTGVYHCGQKTYSLHAGQIFVVYPNTIIKYQADKDDPWHYVWVAFTGSDGEAILAEAGVTPDHPVRSLQNGDDILEVIRAMPQNKGASTKANLHFSARLHDFLSLLLPSCQAERDTESVYFTEATRYIKAHYALDITVEDVAAKVGISRKYLFVVFKKHVGISPKEYILDYRMRRAKDFLADPSLPVGSIAYSVGYKDPLTFSKIFKQRTGLSPSDYRQSLRAER